MELKCLGNKRSVRAVPKNRGTGEQDPRTAEWAAKALLLCSCVCTMPSSTYSSDSLRWAQSGRAVAICALRIKKSSHTAQWHCIGDLCVPLAVSTLTFHFLLSVLHPYDFVTSFIVGQVSSQQSFLPFFFSLNRFSHHHVSRLGKCWLCHSCTVSVNGGRTQYFSRSLNFLGRDQ